jgi:hypothetical protein
MNPQPEYSLGTFRKNASTLGVGCHLAQFFGVESASETPPGEGVIVADAVAL